MKVSLFCIESILGYPLKTLYPIFIVGVYGCYATVFILMLIFGRRARRSVKNETVRALPEGFSPLDVKRIFIGKTYPRRLTRALIAHWANAGLIKVEYISKYKVRITKLKVMPKHDNKKAKFFDRGTYVRERSLFYKVPFNTIVDLRFPLFKKYEVKKINEKYATREDVGVYSAKHYILKVITIVICVVSVLIAELWQCLNNGNFTAFVGVGTALIGLFVFMFIPDMPIVFKCVWCGGWSAGSLAFMLAGVGSYYDPALTLPLAVVLLYAGPLFFIRFVDYREKNNLADYSDLMNYRKFLLHASADELRDIDYYKVLPLLYAFDIKFLVKHKFIRDDVPDWYIGDDEQTGALL